MKQQNFFRLIVLSIALSVGISTSARADDDVISPLDFDLFLAGNYGELRPNHFHAGLDFKTQQSIGHPVHAVADGYIERVGVNAYGYGLVLYVTHPDIERMTVYAHLDTFNDKIWHKVRQRQVAEELNNPDFTFAPNELPVKQGEIIAMSGNTGSSGGPHVHFEVRGLMSAPGADDEKWYDPMPYFIDKIKDTTAPKISNLYIYREPNTPFTRHEQILNRKASAWGKIGFGVKAYDYMDGQANRFGVKKIRLFCDNQLIYSWNQDFFQYHEQRYTNSVIDYKEFATQRSTIMKTYRETCNYLRMIDAETGDGIVDIAEERPYHFRYELEDAHGNRSTLSFVVNGVKREPVAHSIKGRLAKAGEEFRIDTLGVHFRSPAGNLYTDADIHFSSTAQENGETMASHNFLSPIYCIGSATIPLHGFCDLEISLPDSITSGNQLYIANLDGGTYKCRFTPTQAIPFSKRTLPASLRARVRDFGRFVVRKDTIAPHATIIGRPTINNFTIVLSDVGSGVESWKVYIDGQFVPFDKNNRGRAVGHPRLFGIKAGVNHKIEILVTDLVGNEAIMNIEKRF